jgi:hypothetical protein
MQQDRLVTKQRATPIASNPAPVGETQLAEQSSTQPQHQTQNWKPSRGEWLVLTTIGLSSFLTALDAGILVAVLPVRLR